MKRRTLLVWPVALAVQRIAGGAKADVSKIAGREGHLHVDDGGSGSAPPVIFIHAFACSSRDWRAQLAHLRPARRAIAFDVRGHGRSEMPKSLDALSIPKMAEDVEAVIDTLGLQRAVLVGHGMGGPIALAYASRQPMKVAGIVFVDPPDKIPPKRVKTLIARLEARHGKISAQYFETLLKGATLATRSEITKQFSAFPHDAGIAILKSLFTFDPQTVPNVYQGPVLAILADVHPLRPKFPYRTITGTSHWPHIDKPDEFNRILDEFLATIR